MILLNALGWFWAAPFSILGLLIGLLTGSLPYTTRGGAVICRMSKFLLWFFPKDFHVAAFTWGWVIFTRRDLEDRKPSMNGATDRRLVRHEMEHVRQAMRWGPLFPLLYLGSMAVAEAQGKRPYADCYFERAARRAEVEQ